MPGKAVLIQNNHDRVIEQLSLEVTLKDHPIQPFVGKGAHEIICRPVQPHLGNLQLQGLYHVPGKVITVHDCSHCKKFISYVEMKPLLVKLVPVAPCLLQVKREPSSSL